MRKISFVIFDIVVKTNRMSFSVALVKFHWFGINWHVFLPIRRQKLLLVYYYSENRAINRIWKVLPNMVFPPIWGGKWWRFENAHASYLGLSFRPPGRKESSGTGLLVGLSKRLDLLGLHNFQWNFRPGVLRLSDLPNWVQWLFVEEALSPFFVKIIKLCFVGANLLSSIGLVKFSWFETMMRDILSISLS